MPESNERGPQLLDAKEACQLLKVGRSALYAMMAEGALGYVQLGRRRRFRRIDLEKLIQRRLVEAV